MVITQAFSFVFDMFCPSSLTDNLLGLLRIRVKCGILPRYSTCSFVVAILSFLIISFPPFHLTAKKTTGEVAGKFAFSNIMFN